MADAEVVKPGGLLSSPEWSGGEFPYAIGHKKLGMWLFILSDALTFTAMLVAYSYVRVASDNWPTPFHFFPSIVGATVMTLVLLSSSLTMVVAVSASAEGDSKRAMKYVLYTALGGVVFLVLHIREWLTLIGEGVRILGNPWGAELFGATFYLITGLHMFHVFTGVIYLCVVALRVNKQVASHEEVEISGLYWHFVDLVWMFVFPLIYLLSVAA